MSRSMWKGLLRVGTRSALIVAVGGAMLAGHGIGSAAAFPDRPIEMVIGYPPGGGTDTLARLLAQKLSESWGQAVVVQNRPGADGTIASEVVAKAEPDGYTLVMVTSNLTIPPQGFTLNFDPVKSFAPITEIAYAPHVLVVNPKHVKEENLADLIASIKADPNKLNAGSAGPSTAPFLSMALLKKLAGLEIVDVNYKGSGDVLNALLSGDIQLAFVSIAGAVEQVKAGNLRALAVSSKERSSVLPDVPTVAEAGGLASYEGGAWYGLLAPAGTPPEVVAAIQEGTLRTLAIPEIQEAMANQGFQTIGNSPEEFAEIIESDLKKWASLFESIEIK
jgi:tripartite-type tricarboxylate transporter receptor subunit TctC